MRVIRIRKKSGGERMIFAPNAQEKAELRAMLPALTERMAEELSASVHGFVPGRSPVSNAMQHRGKRFTTIFDLQDFFASVRPGMIAGLDAEASKCFVRHAPQQGLPTSPALANLAAAKLDEKILDLIEPWQVVYTRYADDLAFSYDDPFLTSRLRGDVPRLVAEAGFLVNKKKTRTMDSRQGSRIITGIAVDATIRPTRKQKRLLRALRHQGLCRETEAMKAWMEYVHKGNFIFNVECIFCDKLLPDLRGLAGHIMASHKKERAKGRILRWTKAHHIQCYCGQEIIEHGKDFVCLAKHWADDFGLDAHLLRCALL